MEKRERGSNIFFPIILRLLGRISSFRKLYTRFYANFKSLVLKTYKSLILIRAESEYGSGNSEF